MDPDSIYARGATGPQPSRDPSRGHMPPVALAIESHAAANMGFQVFLHLTAYVSPSFYKNPYRY